MKPIFANASSLTIVELLNRSRGREVTLVTGHGREYTGVLADDCDYSTTSTKLIVLNKLAGRELYHLAISKNEIVGIIIYNQPEE